jgi:hypothetical protein
MTPAQEAAILEHGQRLLAVFPEATIQDPIKLCKRLRMIETRCDRHLREGTLGLPQEGVLRTRIGKLLGLTMEPIILVGSPPYLRVAASSISPAMCGLPLDDR